MTETPPAPFGPDHLDRQVEARMGRVMRTQARESWLVPLLAVPLSRIALSEVLDENDILLYAGEPGAGRARDLARRVEAVIQSTLTTGRGLTDAEATMLVELSHDGLGLACGVLEAPGYLLAGAGVPPDIVGEPLARGVARWIADGPQSVAFAALVASHALQMTNDRLAWLPRPHARFAPVTRAIAQRMQAEGVTTWEQALAFAHRFWDAQGWLQLGLWQRKACYRVGEELVLLPRAKAAASREADLRHHRAERRRLQADASEVQEELRTLRPLKDKVERLSEEAERLRLRDAELVHARDRALARVEALETANAELDRARKAAILRLAALAPDPAPAPDPRAIREVVYADELELPAAADSLRVLGARTIRAFCVHKGNLGPETFPPGALVILDIRFVGHSQSSVIADRAERSGARYLAVRSGKGSLARTVATALEEKRLGGG